MTKSTHYNESHQQVLLALFAQADTPQSLLEISTSLGWSDSMTKRYVAALLGADLIELVRFRSRGQRSLYGPTGIGRSVANGQSRSWAARAGTGVPPPTFTTAGSVYQPDQRSYYRNDGNTHIDSYGVRC